MMEDWNVLIINNWLCFSKRGLSRDRPLFHFKTI
jgi:hypothetical protein